MELRQIRYAEAVARYKNFSKAAELLYITQQTLSQQIKKLEDEIGFDIFERSTRSVALTIRGKLFLDKALPVIQAFDAFTSEVDLLRDDSICSLRVGILPTFSHLNILDAVHEFQTKHVSTSVNLQIKKSSRLLDMLLDGQIDAAIANISREEMMRYKKKYSICIFSQDRICAVIGDPEKFSDRVQLSLVDFDKERVLLLSKGSSIRKRMEEAFRQEGIVPSSVYDCPEIHSMIGMVRARIGIGFLSSRIARQFAPPPMRSLVIDPPLETITALIYSRDNINIDALDAFSTFIQKISDSSSSSEK